MCHATKLFSSLQRFPLSKYSHLRHATNKCSKIQPFLSFNSHSRVVQRNSTIQLDVGPSLYLSPALQKFFPTLQSFLSLNHHMCVVQRNAMLLFNPSPFFSPFFPLSITLHSSIMQRTLVAYTPPPFISPLSLSTIHNYPQLHHATKSPIST